MNDKAFKAIEQYHMIQEGDTVAVCLSGGADSMALFHFLCCNRDYFKIKVMALHVNHGLRDESRREEEFVKKRREDMGAPCLVYHARMREQTAPRGMSTELWARKLRYDFFYEKAAEYKAKLATAHTLSDRRETVLFNIIRGSSLKGAVGIPPVRDNIIRPLIFCRRADIESYCRDNNIQYVTDKTNFEQIYARNKIRLGAIPRLEAANSAAQRNIAAFAGECEEIYTLLTQLSDNLYRKSIGLQGIDVSILLSDHPAVVKNLLRNRLEQLGCLSKENVQRIYSALTQPAYKKQLSQKIFCQIENGRLFFYEENRREKRPPQCTSAVNIGSESEFFGSVFTFSLISGEDYKNLKENGKNYLTYGVDYGKIKGALIIRQRKTGDRFHFKDRKVSKSLKKLFIEDKVSRLMRERIAVLSDESGQVIWLEGYGVSSPFVPSEDTDTVLLIKQM